ncbi:hypothetical protein RF11_00279 [Thelohanellus kitauei]|uniref:Rho-GAP domain-containing protein n=1 Tax=Thelohanellus kitauei TaxID=669202 RepID=A0A0C2MLL3_THEKT|nr:hypothetical protein RF11_00279 [Thelohanellus kitauei]
MNRLWEDLASLNLSHRYCLFRLIKHFEIINSNKDRNLMPYYNIGVVFGPTLIESDAIDSPNTVEVLANILINSYELLNSEDFMSGIEELGVESEDSDHQKPIHYDIEDYTTNTLDIDYQPRSRSMSDSFATNPRKASKENQKHSSLLNLANEKVQQLAPSEQDSFDLPETKHSESIIPLIRNERDQTTNIIEPDLSTNLAVDEEMNETMMKKLRESLKPVIMEPKVTDAGIKESVVRPPVEQLTLRRSKKSKMLKLKIVPGLSNIFNLVEDE